MADAAIVSPLILASAAKDHCISAGMCSVMVKHTGAIALQSESTRCALSLLTKVVIRLQSTTAVFMYRTAFAGSCIHSSGQMFHLDHTATLAYMLKCYGLNEGLKFVLRRLGTLASRHMSASAACVQTADLDRHNSSQPAPARPYVQAMLAVTSPAACSDATAQVCNEVSHTEVRISLHPSRHDWASTAAISWYTHRGLTGCS